MLRRSNRALRGIATLFSAITIVTILTTNSAGSYYLPALLGSLIGLLLTWLYSRDKVTSLVFLASSLLLLLGVALVQLENEHFNSVSFYIMGFWSIPPGVLLFICAMRTPREQEKLPQTQTNV